MLDTRKPPPLARTGAPRRVGRDIDRDFYATASASLSQSALEIRAVSAVTTRSHGLFDWADHGPLAHACEVMDEDGRILDCAAWFPAAPNTWWLLTGEGRVLGAHALRVVNPINLFSTPAAWLRANDPRGVCILRWDIWPAHLFGPRQVKCDSEQLAEKVLRRHQAMPPPFEVAA